MRATERPALYQAMFVLPTDVKFPSAETPPRYGPERLDFLVIQVAGSPAG
jgi:hypothetical protein